MWPFTSIYSRNMMMRVSKTHQNTVEACRAPKESTDTALPGGECYQQYVLHCIFLIYIYTYIYICEVISYSKAYAWQPLARKGALMTALSKLGGCQLGPRWGRSVPGFSCFGRCWAHFLHTGVWKKLLGVGRYAANWDKSTYTRV